MSETTLRIGNAAGFWGDTPRGPLALAKQAPNLDVIVLDYLAEVSLSIMAIQRDKNPELGYASDFLTVVESLIPLWQSGSNIVLIANAGGLAPEKCAKECR